MIKPVYTCEHGELYMGEALRVMAQIPDCSVDAIITDPPYSSGGQYRGDRAQKTGDKYVLTNTQVQRPDFSGDSRDQRSWAYWSTIWLTECYRILKPGAPICIFSDWRQLPAATDALQAGGFIWRGVAVWDKGPASRPMIGRFKAQCEYIPWGSKGPMSDDRGVGCLDGCFRCQVDPRDKHHQTGKPVPVMEWLCSVCEPGGLVLDCFAGSGTTGIAAIKTGRRFIMSELEPAYCSITRDRIIEQMKQPALLGLGA